MDRKNGFMHSLLGSAQNNEHDPLLIMDYKGQIEAVNKSQAVIEFNMDGTIITANDNFLNAVGYTLEEIQGQHHAMFVDPVEANGTAYKQFWASLNRGEYQAKEFKRYGKGGKEIWIQASYNPIFDLDNKPFKVVKYATDVTAQKLQNADYEGQIAAINKSQAVIEFAMDGTIITANDNFLNAVGYSLGEVQGKHHSIFVDQAYAQSADYKKMWADLNRGEFLTGEFQRFGKGGREIWIQASYNPILDLNNKPCKVVKYAADITEQKKLRKTVRNMLDEVSKVINALSAGQLGERVNGQHPAEFSDLQKTVNSYCGSLTNIVKDIQGATSSVMSDATKLQEGNLELNNRTESQAASIEETASSMEEMTSTVKQSADNVAKANELAMDACKQAEQGGQVARDAVQSMSEISQSSKQIAAIIGVIDDIAFQTNLLALNAAVEAARAGEQGRGFAVVATEVRTLAGRSATAAKEIKTLIEDSTLKVEEGNKLVAQSGNSLEEIVLSIKKVTDIFSEITIASREQAMGIDQVNQAITQMDSAVQQNAKMAENASYLSASMMEQAEKLNQRIAFFSFGSSDQQERRSGNRPWSQSDGAAQSDVERKTAKAAG